jgi:ABC-2 type transport system ATP-binding protein
MNIIQTDLLTKSFGNTVAVNRMTIRVRQGEIYGFLGLNGAGKTTTIRLLLGMIRPDSGDIRLFGHRTNQASGIWNDIGYLVESPHAYPDLTVRENLEVYCRLRGLPDRKPIDDVIGRLHLGQYSDRPARHLSTGNNQRLGLAKALLHRPKLLLLDEPVNGLDPAGIVEIREFLQDLASNHGTTIFLSSHILSEISRLATRIGIVHEGYLIKELNSSQLEAQIIRKLKIDTNNNEEARQLLQKSGYVSALTAENQLETMDPEAIGAPEKIATLLVNAQLPPKSLYVIEEDLESYFLRIIKEKNTRS